MNPSLELVRESEVVELPRVGGEVEDVVLGALAEPAVARGEHPLQGDGLAVLEGGADHVAAQGDRGPRGTCWSQSMLKLLPQVRLF